MGFKLQLGVLSSETVTLKFFTEILLETPPRNTVFHHYLPLFTVIARSGERFPVL